jgi:ribosomal protein S8
MPIWVYLLACPSLVDSLKKYMLFKQLYHFFHKLSVSISTKQSSFVVKRFPGIDNVLTSLFNLFFIFGYKTYKNQNELEIFLKYDSNGNSIIREVTWLVKGSVHYVISIDDIVLFQKQQLYSTGFVLTRKGILDFKECIKQNTTGVLLAILK